MSKNATTIRDLTPDPRNARKHGKRNLEMLGKSLGEVGAARSIVIDENNVVLAGNGMVAAATAAGLSKVQVVEADGDTIIAVRRSGLTKRQKTRLALYDNRAAELAEWDMGELEKLQGIGALDGLFDGIEIGDAAKDAGTLPFGDDEEFIDEGDKPKVDGSMIPLAIVLTRTEYAEWQVVKGDGRTDKQAFMCMIREARG